MSGEARPVGGSTRLWGARAAWAGLVALASGCGPLVDGDYRGDVLLEVTGQVMIDQSLPADASLGVAVLWSRMEGVPAPEAQSVVVSTSFPASYTVRMYHPPESTSKLDLFGIAGFTAAVGEIIVYEDLEDDDRWTPGEPVVGGSFDATVLWVEDPATVELPNVGWTPEPGFNLVQRVEPFSCMSPWNLWLEERPTNQATLFVGAYWPASFDWDCDGLPDFQPEVSQDYGCADQPVDAECQAIEEWMASGAEPIDAYVQMVESDPAWLDCLLQTCPATVEAARAGAEQAGMEWPGGSR